MKVDCPSPVNKEKTHEKKSNKYGKGRKEYSLGRQRHFFQQLFT